MQRRARRCGAGCAVVEKQCWSWRESVNTAEVRDCYRLHKIIVLRAVAQSQNQRVKREGSAVQRSSMPN